MLKNKEIKQGDVYFVDIGDGVGSEQSKSRPCIIISADIRNESSNNVFVFPITHVRKKTQPCHYILYKSYYPFFKYKENTVLCEEGFSASKKRLQRYLGSICSNDIEEILKAKEYVFIKKCILEKD